MKKLLILIVVVAAGYFAYDYFTATRKSEAYQTYEFFADHLDKERFQEAASMVSADSNAAEAIKYRSSWQRMYGNLSVTQSFRNIDYEEQSERSAFFTISQNTFTVPSSTPPAYPDFLITQEITLTKTAGEWHIDSFSETIEQLETKR